LHAGADGIQYGGALEPAGFLAVDAWRVAIEGPRCLCSSSKLVRVLGMSISEESELLMASSSDDSAPVRVLVVEDDEETANYLHALLDDAGYPVVLAKDGQQALRLFRSFQPDVILMDLGLPGIDGIEVTELIRASARVLPIIMLTAESQTGIKLRGFDAGVDDYMVKPFSGPELLARIGAQLRKQQVIRELEGNQATLEQEVARMASSHQTMTATMELERSMRLDLLHSVSAHLQSLCAVLDAEFRRQSPGAGRDALLRIVPRVHGAALVYQIAEQVTGESLDFSGLLQTIATSLKQVYSPRKRIPIQLQTGQLMIPGTIASPLAMVATELITNAFKHAFPQGRFGAITVTSSCIGNILSLDVIDDGIGITQPAGRGLSSVRQLIASMNGTFTISSSAGGTQAEVRLPIHTEAGAGQSGREPT
jgi:DNA-binding response OmpR family regulator